MKNKNIIYQFKTSVNIIEFCLIFLALKKLNFKATQTVTLPALIGEAPTMFKLSDRQQENYHKLK